MAWSSSNPPPPPQKKKKLFFSERLSSRNLKIWRTEHSSAQTDNRDLTRQIYLIREGKLKKKVYGEKENTKEKKKKRKRKEKNGLYEKKQRVGRGRRCRSKNTNDKEWSQTEIDGFHGLVCRSTNQDDLRKIVV